ncbi:PIR Superfamily Protein [Plasmodium ovale curtisi]|uniref:PIR Superfamily Protein n=1 Tax=Plasmodium ovale curtisi TaxID=864141 RepID=A0A1A8XAP1_PLAOA|nr:PIR Superfamily Protein [Plasmodium ovale curtisi]
MEEAEKILTNLSKYKLYNKFNEEHDDTGKYSNYCRNMTYLIKWYSGIHEVCYMFAKNLINLHEILNEEKDNNKRCIYFNFWITDYVRKMLETEWKGNPHMTSMVRSFLTVENAIKAASQKYNCHFDYNSNIDLYLWKEQKYLHDYIENYNDIKVIINSDGHYYFCNNDKFISKLECDENKGVVTASSREERDQVLEEPDES